MYLWMKSLHIIAMVCWFAGMFYMFRLFVYHAENQEDQSRVDLLKVMERRLFVYITKPAMIATWIFGISTLFQAKHLFNAHWFHFKLVLLIILSGYTEYIGKTMRRFAKDDVFLSSKQCRIRNEFPTLFLIIIVIIAVLKPF